MRQSLAIALIVTFGAGCGTIKAPPAPFTLYNAALLSDDIRPAYPKSQNGDFMGVDTIPLSDQQMVASAPSNTASDIGPAPNARKQAPTPAPAPQTKSVATSFNPAHAAGFIRAVYIANGVEVDLPMNDDAVALLYAAAKRQGKVYHATRPAVGDVVFFHNTYDRNGDGRNNDWYTHAGLVEAVDSEGNIHVLSYHDSKVTSFAINLEHPRKPTGNGILNAQLRPNTDSDPDFTQHLGGELFAGFGNLLGERSEIVVIDNWSPAMTPSSN